MNPISTTVDSLPRSTPRRDLLRILALETRCELLKLWRLRGFVVPTFAFPVVFYLLFGVLLGRHMSNGGGSGAAAYLLVSYAIFGVLGANLHGLGTGLAGERGKGWMRLKRTTPMPPLAHFTARILVGLAFGAAVVLVLFVLGAVAGGVRLERSVWLQLGLWITLGGVPFAALGLALGHRLPPDGAPGLINLVYLPMSFLSGLWIPIMMLPATVRGLARWLPPYHVVCHGHALLGDGFETPSWTFSIAYLAAFTLLCLGIAALAWRRGEERT